MPLAVSRLSLNDYLFTFFCPFQIIFCYIFRAFQFIFFRLNVCNVFIFLGDFKLSLVTIDVISFVCIPSICIGVLQGKDDGDDDDDDDDDNDAMC